MALNLPIERLSYDAIRSKAAKFLQQHHPSGSLPIPIEDIIDPKLGIDIIPVPGLRRSCDVEAFITSDMTAIYVEDYTYSNVETRYRFSLAHEIAHAVLHQKIYRMMEYADIAGWKRTHLDISDEDYAWLEWQAHSFAGLVLVPPDPLAIAWRQARDRASSGGMDLAAPSPAALRAASGWIAPGFAVSTDVIVRRLRYDSHVPSEQT